MFTRHQGEAIMANDIKLDVTSIASIPAQVVKKDESADKSKQAVIHTGDVKVTSQFSNLMLADNGLEADETQRFEVLKNKVQSGNYQIDTDKLTTSIYHHLFNSKVNE